MAPKKSADELLAAFKSWREDGQDKGVGCATAADSMFKESLESIAPANSPERPVMESISSLLPVQRKQDSELESSPPRHGLRSTLSLGRRLLEEDLASSKVSPPHRRQSRSAADTSQASSARPTPASAGRIERDLLAAEVAIDATSSTQASIAVVGVVRGELDMFESRLQVQLSSLQDSVSKMLMRSEKLHEAELQRLEQKVSSTEVSQSRLERRFHEFGGTVKGVSSEIESHVRRTDALDSNVSDFKRKIQEETQERSMALEQSVQDAVSKCRAAIIASENEHVRLMQRVDELEASASGGDSWREISCSLAQLQSSIEASRDMGKSASATDEKKRGSKQDATDEAASSSDHGLRLWRVENDVQDLLKKMTALEAEIFNDEGIGAKIQEHEVYLKALRSKQPDGADHRLRSEFEALLDAAQRRTDEADRKATTACSRIEDFIPKVALDFQELKALHEELKRGLEVAAERHTQAEQARASHVQEQMAGQLRGEVERLVCELLQPWSQAVEAIRREVAALADQLLIVPAKPTPGHDREAERLAAIEVAVAQLRAEVAGLFTAGAAGSTQQEEDSSASKAAQEEDLLKTRLVNLEDTMQRVEQSADSPKGDALGVRREAVHRELEEVINSIKEHRDHCREQEAMFQERVAAAESLLGGHIDKQRFTVNVALGPRPRNASV